MAGVIFLGYLLLPTRIPCDLFSPLLSFQFVVITDQPSYRLCYLDSALISSIGCRASYQITQFTGIY